MNTYIHTVYIIIYIYNYTHTYIYTYVTSKPKSRLTDDLEALTQVDMACRWSHSERPRWGRRFFWRGGCGIHRAGRCRNTRGYILIPPKKETNNCRNFMKLQQAQSTSRHKIRSVKRFHPGFSIPHRDSHPRAAPKCFRLKALDHPSEELPQPMDVFPMFSIAKPCKHL